MDGKRGWYRVLSLLRERGLAKGLVIMEASPESYHYGRLIQSLVTMEGDGLVQSSVTMEGDEASPETCHYGGRVDCTRVHSI